MELTGARPKELADANVGDFDGQNLKLAHRKGRPPKLRTRIVVLSEGGQAFFSGLVKKRSADAPLLTEDGTQRWRRHIWAREVRAACDKHNEKARGNKKLPSGISAYAFRHTRISELLQIHGVDPLTVASQTGTSIAMIERSYPRFIPSAMREKLAAVKDV